MTSSRLIPFNERLIVALDVDTSDKALALVQQLQPLGVTFKVGMQLFYHGGIALVHALQAKGCPLFLDLKLHDIPNTVARATETLVKQGVTFLNVHTQGGTEMMRAAVQAGRNAAEAHDMPPPIIIGVTLLTSLSPATLQKELHVEDVADRYVAHLAGLAQVSGLDGVVCSAQEAKIIRQECGPGFIRVTPGIRPAGSNADDQSRILTPSEAIRAGADFLVVGRPITQSETPARTTETILEEMAACLENPSR